MDRKTGISIIGIDRAGEVIIINVYFIKISSFCELPDFTNKFLDMMIIYMPNIYLKIEIPLLGEVGLGIIKENV